MFHWAMPFLAKQSAHIAWREKVALEGAEVFSLASRLLFLLGLEWELPPAVTLLSSRTEQPQQAPSPIHRAVGEVRAEVCRQFCDYYNWVSL